MYRLLDPFLSAGTRDKKVGGGGGEGGVTTVLILFLRLIKFHVFSESMSIHEIKNCAIHAWYVWYIWEQAS